MAGANADLYDVAIIGSGIGGSTLATILARHGHSVLLLEAGSHPRFAIGESVVPEFSARARLMAATFHVPELGYMGTFQQLRHHISGNSGIKRNFTFLQHRDGVVHRPEDTCQFRTMSYPLGPDTHIYRPDLDHWLTALAIKYGATYRERSSVTSVTETDGGMRIEAGGNNYRARFVVDGSGFRSVLAERADTTLRTDSRSIFNHFVGVRPLRREPRVPSPPDQGTLHHLFHGGWFWVIPFNNHVNHVNPVCSVGLTLDRKKHPDNDMPADEEFFSFVNRFPSVRAQLGDARAVRSWVKTGRIQYQSRHVAGKRWCLLPHATGFVDPLFSGGMTLTLVGVDEVGRLLLDALKTGDFDRFGGLEETARENMAILDRIVHGAFISFRSPQLFNAWFRVWATGNYHATAALSRLHMKYLSTRDRKYLDKVTEAPYRRVLAMDHPRLRALLDEAYAIITRVESGELAEGNGTDALFSLLGSKAWIPPHFHIANRQRNQLASFTVFPLLSLIFWGRRKAPDDMKRVFYDIGPNFFWELTKSMGREAWRSMSSFIRAFLDAHNSRFRS